MINFANVKEWKIPYNGSLADVIKVTDTNNTRVIWEKPSSLNEPFYVENISNQQEDVQIKKQFYTSDQTYADYAPTITIETSVDKINWSTLGSTSPTALHIFLNPGDKVYLRASTTQWANQVDYDSSSSLNPIHIHGILWNSIVGCSKVGGNIMSLLYGSSFTGEEKYLKNANYTFYSLFSDIKDDIAFNYDLINADSLILPALTTRVYCYASMFYGCASLTSIPSLPATSLGNHCYYQMFRHCTSLTQTTQLPATTVADYAYSYMFKGCSLLWNVKEISAITMKERSCSFMFADCSSLVNAPALYDVETIGTYCYYGMFKNCIALTSPPYLRATALANGCYYDMFNNCSSLLKAPVLRAATLVTNCYYQMFYNCSSLNYIYCRATDLTASGCLKNWTNGVSNSGDFYRTSGVNWPTGYDGIPSGWTIHNQ